MKRILKLIAAGLFFTGMAVAQESGIQGEDGNASNASALAKDTLSADGAGRELAACRRKEESLKKKVIVLVRRLKRERAARKAQVAELQKKLEKAESRLAIPPARLQILTNRLRKAEERLNAILDELEGIIGK